MSSDGPLNKNFQSLIDRLLAVEQMKGAYVYSGYRNNAHQDRLFQERLRRSGGNVDKARHWVAPPGHSNHNHGIAADMGFTSPEQRTWLRNAQKEGTLAKMGLQLRMSHEGWHVEPFHATGDHHNFFGDNADPVDTDQSLARAFVEKWGPYKSEGPYKPDITTLPEVNVTAKREPMANNYEPLIMKAAQQYGVPPELLKRMMSAESSGNPTATSDKGAKGLIQIMPGTAKELGVSDPYDPEQNIMGAAKYMRKNYDTFGNWQYATAAYNAGPTGINRRGNPDNWPSETQAYVHKIHPEEFDQQGLRPGSPEMQRVLQSNGVTPMLPSSGQRDMPVKPYPEYNPQVTNAAAQPAVGGRAAAPTPAGDPDWEKKFKLAQEEQIRQEEEARKNQLPPGYGDMGMFKAGFSGMANPGYEDVSKENQLPIMSMMQILMADSKNRKSSFDPALFGGMYGRR